MEDALTKLWETLIELATTIGLRLVYALLLVIIGLRLTKWLVKRVKRGKGFARIDESLAHLLCSIIKITLDTLVLVTAAMILGVPTASFVTVLGSAGLAMGLALQGSLANFAGSIMILMFKPFKIGDYIKCGELEGTVIDINFFYTVLKTLDNKQVTLPNGTLSNSNIENYNANGTRRIDFVFSVSYGSDIAMVKRVFLGVAAANPLVLKEPAPLARLAKHNESSLDFAFQVWCKDDDYWDVLYDMNEQIKIACTENGIEIPFPQVDVHISQK